jgi:hypothetical protein
MVVVRAKGGILIAQVDVDSSVVIGNMNKQLTEPLPGIAGHGC